MHDLDMSDVETDGQRSYEAQLERDYENLLTTVNDLVTRVNPCEPVHREAVECIATYFMLQNIDAAPLEMMCTRTSEAHSILQDVYNKYHLLKKLLNDDTIAKV